MTTTTPSAVQPMDGALQIPVTLIAASPLNPRKRWNDDKVRAIAADMAANGQIQPIRVRPNPQHTPSNGRPPYEIVVGETRWRAAPLAGLGELDAVVRDCTDQELIKLALAENTKRQDLHPLEEADGFAALLRDPDGLHGYTSKENLAAAVGVSPSYVYQRLKLRNLCAAGREAFLAGTIDASVALLIARMPDHSEQARATARIVTGFGGEPYSYRQASEFLKKEFMLSLALARFDVTATYKVAGPCSGCDKRSGAAPDLFADVASAGDLCQDARCHAAKCEEAHQQLLQAARDAGRIVLQGAKARAVLPRPDAEPVGHYRLDAPVPALTDSARPLRALLGQGSTTSIVVIDLPGTPPLELVPHEAAERAIRARGLLKSQTAKPKPTAPAPQPDKAQPVFKPKPTEPAAVYSAPVAGPSSAGEAPAPRGEGAAGVVGAAAGGGGEKTTSERAADGAGKADEAVLVRRKFGQLLMSELADDLQDADELPLVILRCTIEELWADLSAEECDLVLIVFDSVPTRPVDFGEALAELLDNCNGRGLGELLALVLAVRDCYDVPESLFEFKRRPAGVLARHFGTSFDNLQRMARIAAGAAGKAAPDATTAFVTAHSPAGGADEVTDEASDPTENAREPWTYPVDEHGRPRV